MNLNEIDFYPVMGEKLSKENTMKLDFSPTNADLEQVDLADTTVFDQYVSQQLCSSGKTYGIGGYLEHRAIYKRSAVFVTDEADFRNIHLGIDIWTEAGAPIFTPLDGKIHSFQDNVGFGNYGATIILEHQLGEKILYSLYGHLCLSDLENLEIGQEVKSGDLLAHVGPFPENGDWPPHLHFQLMRETLGNVGDFPGVCSQREIDKYSDICPNPNLILCSEVL